MGLAWGALVLAAGSGSRMGTRPKCLLQLQGQPLITRHLCALSEVGVAHTVVVLGHHADVIGAAVGETPCVHNPHPDAGQNSSLHLGLQALPSDTQAVVVLLADQPLITPDSLAKVLGAFESSRHADTPMDVLVPWHADDQVPGNPVAFSARVREAILAAPPDWGCKQWQQAHPARVQRWPTTDPAYFTDLDTPQDLLALAQRTGLNLTWPEAAP